MKNSESAWDYRKARELGLEEAEDRLKNLGEDKEQDKEAVYVNLNTDNPKC